MKFTNKTSDVLPFVGLQLLNLMNLSLRSEETDLSKTETIEKPIKKSQS